MRKGEMTMLFWAVVGAVGYATAMIGFALNMMAF